MKNHRRWTALVWLTFVAAACHRQQPTVSVLNRGTMLLADSTRYTVRLVGEMYSVRIGFRFTNRTGGTVSANYCGVPTPPRLEKQMSDGTWRVAYSPIVLLCETMPPFRIPQLGVYQSVLDVRAGRREAKVAPTFDVDSVPGTYRLRWRLAAGPDPNESGVGVVEAISPPFRLVGP